MKVEDCFDKDGNFTLKGFDPYSCKEEHKYFYDVLFQEPYGNVYITDELEAHFYETIFHKDLRGSFDITCDLVKLYHYNKFASGTKGAYPVIYGWR